MRFLTILLVLLLGLLAYIRFAPVQASVFHQPSKEKAPGDYQQPGGFEAVRLITVPGPEILAALETRALATPRTRLLAGSSDAGMITFVTRSAIWGFPDFTTAAVSGDLLHIHGRLRFGYADMGVNKARVLAWLETLSPLTKAL